MSQAQIKEAARVKRLKKHRDKRAAEKRTLKVLDEQSARHNRKTVEIPLEKKGVPVVNPDGTPVTYRKQVEQIDLSTQRKEAIKARVDRQTEAAKQRKLDKLNKGEK